MYPGRDALRDRFVLDRRGPRPERDPWRHQGVVVEDEPDSSGGVSSVATVFLTGRECPWRCVMCDLWQQTTAGDTPAGAIPAQIEAARRSLASCAAPVRIIKLYNAGSFFDPRAVPESDYDAIAVRLDGLSRVIVESHPALVGERTRRFAAALAGARPTAAPRLEVALGLETVHPDALGRLNKRMTVEDFRRAAGRLSSMSVALRVFLLIAPPFVPRTDQDAWLCRSVETAFAAGATAVSIIPARPGNGALDALAEAGDFSAPALSDIERSAALAWRRGPYPGRLLVDLWNLDRFADCPDCLQARRARLHAMNLAQQDQPAVPCGRCGGSTGT